MSIVHRLYSGTMIQVTCSFVDPAEASCSMTDVCSSALFMYLATFITRTQYELRRGHERIIIIIQGHV